MVSPGLGPTMVSILTLPVCVWYCSYASTPYGSALRPSYSFSYFIKRIPGVLIEGGGIRGLKKIEIAGSTQFEWGQSILPGSYHY